MTLIASLRDTTLAEAAAAERDLWASDQPDGAVRLARRDSGVRSAAAAGNDRDAIADALGIQPCDVDRIIAAG